MDKIDSLERLSYIKDILGISDYNELISYFNKDIFKKLKASEDNNTEKTDINQAEIKRIDNQKYTGKECLPEIYVIFDGRTLINDVDYDVVYLNNIEPGEANVVIVGLNEFQGIKKTNFIIE